MKLLFVARAIGNMPGGVERMIITVMHAMLERGHQVDLLTWDAVGAKPFYSMDTRIEWHRADIGDPARRAGLGVLMGRMRFVRALMRRRQPDLVVAFQDGPFIAMRTYCLGLGLPMVAAERNAPTRFDFVRGGARKKAFSFAMLRLAQLIVVQCEAYRTLYPRSLRSRIAVIPNPVAPAVKRACPGIPGEAGRYGLLSVGRLSFQKNFECLIRAFSSLAARFPDWTLTILGEGESRTTLSWLVDQLGMADRILLPGASPDPSGHYAGANLFCLPSRWEGFPNALAEAMAHGLPAVGFADCAGVNELIVEGETGSLAPGMDDPAALARTLARLMADGQLRDRMGEAAVRSVERYEHAAIMSAWEEAFARAE